MLDFFDASKVEGHRENTRETPRPVQTSMDDYDSIRAMTAAKGCQQKVETHIHPNGIGPRKRMKSFWLERPTQLLIHGQWWSCTTTRRSQLASLCPFLWNSLKIVWKSWLSLAIIPFKQSENHRYHLEKHPTNHACKTVHAKDAATAPDQLLESRPTQQREISLDMSAPRKTVQIYTLVARSVQTKEHLKRRNSDCLARAACYR